MLADFGSRLIDDSEWDEPEDDDPLELNELFNFEALTDFPVFNFQEFSPENSKICSRSTQGGGGTSSTLGERNLVHLSPTGCLESSFLALSFSKAHGSYQDGRND